MKNLETLIEEAWENLEDGYGFASDTTELSRALDIYESFDTLDMRIFINDLRSHYAVDNNTMEYWIANWNYLYLLILIAEDIVNGEEETNHD